MQKREMANCPLCRAPTVLQANPCKYTPSSLSCVVPTLSINRVANVDYGLLNFMADWFPIESREKQRVNEREVTREQLEELGISEARGCRIM